MAAATWASPLTYLSAVLTALSQAGTISGVAPCRLRIDASGAPDDLSWENTADGVLASGYVGATARVLSFGADSATTYYVWTGAESRIPGLQPQILGQYTATRSGQHGQPGLAIQDTVGVWPSRGTIADLTDWYEFCQVWLAGVGACEIRYASAVEVWHLLDTEVYLDVVSSDGTYTRCDLPVCRGV
jgi:hypothetical protein